MFVDPGLTSSFSIPPLAFGAVFVWRRSSSSTSPTPPTPTQPSPAKSGALSPPAPPPSSRRRPFSALFSSTNLTKKAFTASLRHSKPAPLDNLDSLAPDPTRDQSTYSPLDPPALPFLARSSTGRSRSKSTSSTTLPATPYRERKSSALPFPSLGDLARAARPRVQLDSRASASSSFASATLANGPAEPMHGLAVEEDASGGAQEELLDDRAVAAGAGGGKKGGYVDPYAWERPLDAVNRHSRLMDAEPILPGTAFGSDTRRLSRLPPGVSMVDPFGFNLTSDVSPYDLAAFSQSPPTPGTNALSRSSPVRTSFLGPGYQPQMTASPQLSPRLSAASGTSTAASAASSSALPSSTAATSPATSPGSSEYGFSMQNGVPQQPWMKPRASSAGEQGGYSKAQIRNGLLAPGTGMGGMPPRGVSQRSKLSGEIDADAMSIASTTSRQASSALPPPVPTDSDYLNSKLYQRTLRAQKALDKERAKAASKGKLSRYDEEASKSTGSLHLGFGLGRRTSVSSSRPPSIMSAVGVAGATGKRSGRKSLGWFRSASEAALTLSNAAKEELAPPALPASKSSSQISALGAGRRSPSSGGSSSFGGSAAGGGGESPGSAAGSGTVTPLPPSPNLPSESTLRAMGVSTDQLRAAAQAQPAQPPPSPRGATYPSSPSSQNGVQQRPRSGGRGGSGTGRNPQASIQPSMSPVPPSPTEPTPPQQHLPPAQPKPTAVPLAAFAPPPIPQLQQPPTRKASLEPPPIASPPVASHSAPPAQGGPVQVPPRTASRPAVQQQQQHQQPATVPLPPSLPPSASPTRSNFPLSSGAPTSRQASPLHSPSAAVTPSSASFAPAPASQAQARPSPAHPYPQPQSTSSSSRSLPAGAAPAHPSPVPTLSPASAPSPASSPALAVPAPEPQVKRRKSGLGLLFGGGSGRSSAQSNGTVGTGSERSSIASASTATVREGSPAPSGGEKERMMQRMKERQEAEAKAKKLEEEQQKKKLSRKETNGGGGGFFGFGSGGANKLRSSGGPSSKHQPAPSAAQAPPPPPGARAPERQKQKEKKEDVPFFHPSQALHASRQPDPVQPPQPAQTKQQPQYSPLPPSSPSEAQIRAVNASPPAQYPSSPNPATFSHNPHPIAAQHQQQHTPRTDSSSASSTTFSSLSSSSSTPPPSTPANAPVAPSATASINKKSGLAAFFSMGGNGGSLRGRTKSNPSAPPSGLHQQQQQGKTLPGLPSLPPPVANGMVGVKPPARGQSLGQQQQQQGQDGRGQPKLASHKPYATYA